MAKKKKRREKREEDGKKLSKQEWADKYNDGYLPGQPIFCIGRADCYNGTHPRTY